MKSVRSIHVSVLLTVTLMFLLGVLLGMKVSEYRMKEFETTSKLLRRYLLDLQLQALITSKNICNIDVTRMGEDKIRLGKYLSVLESQLGKEHEDVLDLKRDYTLLSIYQWVLMKDYQEKCDSNITLVLFFYSNVNNVSECERQGYVLDYLYYSYPKTVVVYALDYDIDTGSLNVLKELYDVRRVPTVVINDVKFEGFHSFDELKGMIFESHKHK